MNWYKKIIESSAFGTDPFGSSSLSQKTTTSPFGECGGDEHNGLMSASDSTKNHHPSDFFSESNHENLTEEQLEEIKNKKKKKKKILKKKIEDDLNKNSHTSSWYKTAQFGLFGPELPILGVDNWMGKVVDKVKDIQNEDKVNKKHKNKKKHIKKEETEVVERSAESNILYNLIKKAYSLGKEDKVFLNQNINAMVNILDNQEEFSYDKSLEDVSSGEHPLFVLQKVAKFRKHKKQPAKPEIFNLVDISDPANDERMNDPASFNSINPRALNSAEIIKTSSLNDLYSSGNMPNSILKVSHLYDPETPKQILNLIGLMERFSSIEDDYSSESMGIFLYPLVRGAKRLAVRPAKIVGLTKELWAMSRQFDKIKKSKNDNIDVESSSVDNSIEDIKRNFRDKIELMKNKIASIIENKENISTSEISIDIEPSKVKNESLGEDGPAREIKAA